MENANNALLVNSVASFKDFITNIVNRIILNVINNFDGAGSDELIQQEETLAVQEKFILRSFLLREDLVLAWLSIECLQEVMGIYDEMYELSSTVALQLIFYFIPKIVDITIIGEAYPIFGHYWEAILSILWDNRGKFRTQHSL